MKFVVFIGGLKPPHAGHFKLISHYLNDKTISKIYVIISPKYRLVQSEKKTYQLSKTELEHILHKQGEKSELKKILDKRVQQKKIHAITAKMSKDILDIYFPKEPKKEQKLYKIISFMPSPLNLAYAIFNRKLKKGDELITVSSHKDVDKRYDAFASLKKRGIKVTNTYLPEVKKVSGTKAREFIHKKKKSEFFKLLPPKLSISNKQKVWNIVKPSK